MRSLVWLLLLAVSQTSAQEDGVAIAPFSRAEPGAALPDGWRAVTFAKIPQTTHYALVKDGDTVVLRAEADSAASALAYRLPRPTSTANVLRWRWKAETLPGDADTTVKSRDDAAARIYVTFELVTDKLGRMERLKYRALRAWYGEDAPDASIIYVWDNRAAIGTRAINPYTDRARTVVVESGTTRLGQWQVYERDVLADYRALFGAEPPPVTGIGLMTDADNTRSRAVASYGDITLRPR